MGDPALDLAWRVRTAWQYLQTRFQDLLCMHACTALARNLRLADIDSLDSCDPLVHLIQYRMCFAHLAELTTAQPEC